MPSSDSIASPSGPARSAVRSRRRPRATDATTSGSRLIEQIGNTPLLRLDAIGRDLPDTVSLYAKAEHLNPGGSVKDRPALRMIDDGIAAGELTGDRTLIDATSGNTGIAYAMIGAARGLSIALALPENASEERKQILRAYGAKLILTDPLEGTDGAQARVKQFVKDHSDAYFYANQYDNDANWKAHYDGTGREILEQTGGRVTHFVAGLGTTGTFMGTTRRLKEERSDVRAIAMQPDSPMHAMEGLKHMETARVPGIYVPEIADEHVTCRTADAIDMTRRLAREEGLLIGPSGGANVHAALRIAESLDQGVVVTILCDTGTRYLSDDLFSD
ncbi:PLP-dependent cysteine synthase family protein [Longibacter sp.]|jgi:cysteine synthase B|uniref:PLP-dependent cysteine synthase family protein n=1 Tax=Longibacter sp. TaxID=2045415 RepID=UPI003EBE7459